MTSPIESITVDCPACSQTYEDWHRRSVNLDLDAFSEEHVRQATTTTCPTCGHVVELGTLVVRDGVWIVG